MVDELGSFRAVPLPTSPGRADDPRSRVCHTGPQFPPHIPTPFRSQSHLEGCTGGALGPQPQVLLRLGCSVRAPLEVVP